MPPVILTRVHSLATTLVLGSLSVVLLLASAAVCLRLLDRHHSQGERLNDFKHSVAGTHRRRASISPGG